MNRVGGSQRTYRIGIGEHALMTAAAPDGFH